MLRARKTAFLFYMHLMFSVGACAYPQGSMLFSAQGWELCFWQASHLSGNCFQLLFCFPVLCADLQSDERPWLIAVRHFSFLPLIARRLRPTSQFDLSYPDWYLFPHPFLLMESCQLCLFLSNNFPVSGVASRLTKPEDVVLCTKEGTFKTEVKGWLGALWQEAHPPSVSGETHLPPLSVFHVLLLLPFCLESPVLFAMWPWPCWPRTTTFWVKAGIGDGCSSVMVIVSESPPGAALVGSVGPDSQPSCSARLRISLSPRCISLPGWPLAEPWQLSPGSPKDAAM